MPSAFIAAVLHHISWASLVNRYIGRARAILASGRDLRTSLDSRSHDPLKTRRAADRRSIRGSGPGSGPGRQRPRRFTPSLQIALQFAAPLRPPYVRQQSLLAAGHPANRADFALWLPDHGLHRTHAAALASYHETVAR